MVNHLRRLLPDAVLVLGIACALVGAALITPAAALLLFGVGLVGLAVWMSS